MALYKYFKTCNTSSSGSSLPDFGKEVLEEVKKVQEEGPVHQNTIARLLVRMVCLTVVIGIGQGVHSCCKTGY